MCLGPTLQGTSAQACSHMDIIYEQCCGVAMGAGRWATVAPSHHHDVTVFFIHKLIDQLHANTV